MLAKLNELYSSRCSVCGGYHNLPSLNDHGLDPALNKLVEQLAHDLYYQKVTIGYISHDLYSYTADKLLQSLNKGLGAVNFGYDEDLNALKAFMQFDIFKFSAAKSMAEMEQFKALMLDERGKLVDFNTFKNKVLQAGYSFNKTHLQTEFNTAVTSVLMAKRWQNLSTTQEYLQYSTAHDDRVRPEHAALDGLTLHVSSPVWNTIWPPIDWNCRCTVVPGVASKATLSDAEAGRMGNFINPIFRNNSGKTKLIFKEDHPYYITANFKAQELDAVKNYGLKTPKQIFSNPKLPVIPLTETESEFKTLYTSLANNILIDQNGLSLKLSDDFEAHILSKQSEKRYKYAANVSDVIKNADEVWAQKKNNQLTTYYIKYYQDGAYVAISNIQNNQPVIDSFYKVTDVRLKELRKGILLKK